MVMTLAATLHAHDGCFLDYIRAAAYPSNATQRVFVPRCTATMPSFLLLFCFCLTSFCVLSSSQSLNSSLPLKGFQYKLPDGYAIGRSTGSGDLYPGEVFGAILVAMFGLAYEKYYN